MLFTVNVQDIYDTAGHVGTSTTTHAGARAGHQPTTFACVVALYQIAQHYRGGKPKGFWPFGIQADTSNGSDWLPTPIGAFNSGLTNLAAAIDGDSSGGITVGPQQAVSFYQGSQSNPDPSKWAPRNSPKPRSTAVVYPVIGIACSTKIGSQRRRRT